MAKKTRKQQLFVLLSGLLFAGTLASSTISMFSSANQTQASQPDTANAAAAADSLAAQVRGYELVLEREPHNFVALEGLAATYLQMNDPEAAIAPLEKLVTLNPDRRDYADQLAEARKQVSDRAK